MLSYFAIDLISYPTFSESSSNKFKSLFGSLDINLCAFHSNLVTRFYLYNSKNICENLIFLNKCTQQNVYVQVQ